MGRKHRRKAGFTLVELSIVLVIIGLLIGGVLVGQDLIRSAELQNVAKEYEQIRIAISNFKQRYNALPGDMVNATQYWGRADNGAFSGQCANPESNTGTGKQTCNGNGDARIPASGDVEMFRFWQHLANAELFPGTYTGVPTADSAPAPAYQGHKIGENCPASKVSAAGWGFDEASLSNNSTYWYNTSYGNNNALILGGEQINPDGRVNPEGAILSPQEAAIIDSKMDDGMPGTGKVWVTRRTDCTTSSGMNGTDYETATYLSDVQDTLCALTFPNAF